MNCKSDTKQILDFYNANCNSVCNSTTKSPRRADTTEIFTNELWIFTMLTATAPPSNHAEQIGVSEQNVVHYLVELQWRYSQANFGFLQR